MTADLIRINSSTQYNQDSRLFVLAHSGGHSCLGLDVAIARAGRLAAWLGVPGIPDVASPAEVWESMTALKEAAWQRCKSAGIACPAELTPALIGLEGRRVEVITPNGERSRFIVGKSSGWLPCHLAIARRNCHGGPAAYVPAGSAVRVVA